MKKKVISAFHLKWHHVSHLQYDTVKYAHTLVRESKGIFNRSCRSYSFSDATTADVATYHCHRLDGWMVGWSDGVAS